MILHGMERHAWHDWDFPFEWIETISTRMLIDILINFIFYPSCVAKFLSIWFILRCTGNHFFGCYYNREKRERENTITLRNSQSLETNIHVRWKAEVAKNQCIWMGGVCFFMNDLFDRFWALKSLFGRLVEAAIVVRLSFILFCFFVFSIFSLDIELSVVREFSVYFVTGGSPFVPLREIWCPGSGRICLCSSHIRSRCITPKFCHCRFETAKMNSFCFVFFSPHFLVFLFFFRQRLLVSVERRNSYSLVRFHFGAFFFIRSSISDAMEGAKVFPE